jgi:ABC-type branched-subunit amino acid transport system substrate-binding protein
MKAALRNRISPPLSKRRSLSLAAVAAASLLWCGVHVAGRQSVGVRQGNSLTPSGHGLTPSGRGLTTSERRGKELYLRGTSAAGRDVLAYLGDASLEVPASTVSCAGCHGLHGEGKSEGGVVPGNLTWEVLTKPYGHTHASGRKHRAFDEATLAQAVTKGFDPSGNRLASVMPRYDLTPEEMADLTAYLKRIAADRDPGLSDTAINVGSLLPTAGPQGEIGQTMRAVLNSYFDEVNAQGGIYGRRIEMRFGEASDKDARAQAERFLEREQVFALTGGVMAGAEDELTRLAAEREVPVVGPFTLFPQTSTPLNRQVFYLFSGLEEQARSLVDFAAEKSPDAKAGAAAFVYAEGDMPAGVEPAVERQFRKDGWKAVRVLKYRHEGFDAARLAREAGGANVLLFLGSGAEESALLAEAAKSKWTPTVLLLGPLSGPEVFNAPAAFRQKIFLAFPSAPSDQTRDGVAEFRAFAERHRLPQRHLAAQLSAYCAAKILVEGLKRAGRELSREKLVESLEGLYEFNTGLTPPITYGPNRRVGADGAYVISVDLANRQFVPASNWITPG